MNQDFMHEPHEHVEKNRKKNQRDHNTKKNPDDLQMQYTSYGSTLRKGVKSGPAPAALRPTSKVCQSTALHLLMKGCDDL